MKLNTTFGDAIRLLLLTGARKTEVLGLQWNEVDFGRKILVLPRLIAPRPEARPKSAGSRCRRPRSKS